MAPDSRPQDDEGASWSDAVDEIATRRELAARMGGEERVARQRAQGKLTIRERIDSFLDQDSFFEIGGMAGTGEYDAEGRLTDFIPSGYVLGLGTVDGRQVCVGGEDFTVRGGSGGGGRVPGAGCSQPHCSAASRSSSSPMALALPPAATTPPAV